MTLFDTHLDETKKLLEDLANKIMLNKDDLSVDPSMFAPLKQKINNVVLSDYLLEFANQRLESFYNLCPDESFKDQYRSELTDYLRALIRRKV